LRRPLTNFCEHYHAERPQQGKGNVLLFPTQDQLQISDGRVLCKERLGGLLKLLSRPREFFGQNADQWQRRLFSALCRRYGLEPYRYKGQRYTTVIVCAAVLWDKTLWPEYLELQAVLHSYLNEATERIIREEFTRMPHEAADRAG
jgi:hypothetical protein